ncbi:MAG: DUF6394 family protein [Cocleimonas sp.]
MNSEKVTFAFFIVLALTLNFGFFIGEMTDPDQHHVFELFAAIVVSLISTVLKVGDRSHLGAVFLATSLVADLQLVAAAVVWGMTTSVFSGTLEGAALSTVVSLSGGALLANLISVVLLVSDTITVRK